MRVRFGWVAWVVVGCGSPRAGAPPRLAVPLRAPGATEIVCPPGTVREQAAESDVGWGEVERTDGCWRPDGRLEGTAIEWVSSAPGQASTRLVGRYVGGARVGAWTQLDDGTGAVLGSFTLDEQGTGVEIIHDQLGHSREGRVVAGKRDGTWTYRDRDGTVVATQVWSNDAFVRATGRAPWDPPMVDPNDVCPVTPPGAARRDDDEDGCP